MALRIVVVFDEGRRIGEAMKGVVLRVRMSAIHDRKKHRKEKYKNMCKSSKSILLSIVKTTLLHLFIFLVGDVELLS